MLKLLDTHHTAERLGLARATLAKLRVVGGGPAFVRLGTKVLYDEAELAAWLDSKPRLRSTADGAVSARRPRAGRPPKRQTTAPRAE
jgi:predicted DNA-binding transcriptional regulator AlpA